MQLLSNFCSKHLNKTKVESVQLRKTLKNFVEKNFCPKKILATNNFESQRILIPKKNVGPKICFAPKNIQKNVGPKKLFWSEK